MSLEAFVWNSVYETGLAEVDAQHRHLVELINRLGDETDSATPETIRGVLKELAHYAAQHFATEDRLMREAPLDPAHLAEHRAAHTEFVRQVQQWFEATPSPDTLPALIGFLSGWLIYHILEEDQAMARQLRAVASGQSPKEAWQEVRRDPDPRYAVLLEAVQRLYGGVLERNRRLSESNLELKREQRALQAAKAELQRINSELETRIEARTRELVEAQGQLLQSEKLVSLGRIAAGIAHELNTPLGYVQANLQVLDEYLGTLAKAVQAQPALAADGQLASILHDAPQLLAETRQGIAKVGEIVARMAAYAHIEASQCQDLDLAACLRDAVAASLAQHPAPGVAIVDGLTPLPRVQGDVGLLTQALRAVVDNAVIAMAGQGTLRLDGGSDADSVWVRVCDTGPGIAESEQARLFEPFYTTWPVGLGLGLGLTVAWHIASQHGGAIEVASQPGHGACFTLRLPRQTNATARAPSPDTTPQSR